VSFSRYAAVRALALVFSQVALTAPAAEFDFSKGDHVAIVGNTLADRIQHYGWLETMLQTRFSKQELVFRNLGFSADTLTTRPRSQNFGTPDEWLAKVKADVIFAFFGYNESFAGEKGVAQFRQQLADYVDHLQSHKYNTRYAPRLVLFSPIAHEDLQNPNLPDGSENNARLKLYTAVIQDVASEKGVLFVNLFDATRRLYQRDGAAHTINGIHLNDRGNAFVARAIVRAMFSPPGAARVAKVQQRVVARKPGQQDKVTATRKAVLAKNHIWHNIYRATDGYSVFGGRSGLQFVDGQTNFEVQERELEMLNVMAANRDKVIWAAVNGKTIEVDDSNLPDPVPVISNKRGPLEGGKHEFLGGEEAIEMMTMHSGMEIGLFASEEQFPELVNPVQSAVDTDGRLWVAAWPTYPHWNPRGEMNDKLLILPDDNGDGKADRCITFADGLHNPTGFEFWNGGVLVAMAPDIFFLKDTDGDDKADIRERIFHGLDSADTHHTANGFVMGPAGRFYFSRGIFHYENFETPTRTYRADSGTCGVFRFDPVKFEIDHQFRISPNPHGDCFDQWGRQMVNDGTSGTGDYVGFPGRGAPKRLFNKRMRPVPATLILDSDHFPESVRGNMLIENVIGFQGVMQYKFEEDGASLHASEVETIVYSTDPNFRPSDMEIGGDGALYILDWQNPLIGHMQHNLRDPSRDKLHGRVYRVTATGRPTMPVAKMKGKPVAEVVQYLGSSTLGERYRARLELTGRDSEEVVAAAVQWAAQFDASNPEHGRPLTEALWTCQRHRIPELDLLEQVIGSANENARASAVKVLAEWAGVEAGGRRTDSGVIATNEAIGMLVDLANDPGAKVRAQAVIAAAELGVPQAAEIIFAALLHPTDIQLDFNIKEALKTIDAHAWIRQQMALFRGLSPAANAFALANSSVNELLKMEKTEAVYQAIMTRENVPVQALQESLSGLAEFRSTSEIEQLFNLIEGLNDKADANILNSLARLLSSQPADQLRSVRRRIVRLATNGNSAEARRVALASWMTADGDAAGAFAAAGTGNTSIREVLSSVGLITSDAARDSAFEKVATLVPTLPGSTGSRVMTKPGLTVDFFAPNPGNVAVETLSPLEPNASGDASTIIMNVSVLKTRDAFALRFTGHIKIDQPGDYTFYIASDDGSRFYIDGSLLVNNDGLHGMVEKSGRVSLTAGTHPIVATYFDNGGGDGLKASWSGPGFGKQEIQASVLVTAAEQTLQEIGIASMMQLPGHEATKTAVLSGLLKKRQSVTTSFAALATIPGKSWPQDQAGTIGEAVLSLLASKEPHERNSPQARVALDIGSILRRRLGAAGRRRFDARLAELVVPLIKIGTVPERMIYDNETIAVQAGRPVEFALSNADKMPHNFAIVLPGTMEEVGELAEATGRDKDAAARSFIPKSTNILAASRLLQPGQSDSVFFAVPTEPGVYPYVCTYPGHWRRMYGAMYVVADLDAYNADSAGYAAANELKIEDELLNYLGRNTEWKLADLSGDVEHLHHRGNNFAVGEQLFKVAACIGCHKLNGKGNNVGPDLAKLDPKYSAVDVLEHILDPSKKIDKKFQSNLFVLTSGKAITGLVVKETDGAIQIIDNPTSPDKVQTIRKSEIDEREVSNVSIMPKGVMNKLIKEEILDLLAYVIAKGHKKSDLFAEHNH
jgi:putative heme-binding domain-containing protein